MRIPVPSGMTFCTAVLSLLVIAVLPRPATAKGLLESIFGFLGGNSEQSPQVTTQPRPPSPIPQYDGTNNTNPFQADPRRSVAPAKRGRYKTVCVRLCDGFFFPISNSSSRRDFYDDAQQCRSQCSSETRLYYMPRTAASVDNARGQRGGVYSDLQNAFLYRKKLKKGCACRPEPWSVSERMRHKTYAPAAQDVLASLDIEAETAGPVVTAKPTIVGESRIPRQPVNLRPPAPQEALRSAPKPVQLLQQPRPIQKQQPVSQPAWGLGAVLPKVKYRHQWDRNSN